MSSLFHDVFGHLNPRVRRSDGAVVYGATCNMSIDLRTAHRLDGTRGSFFDCTFPGASYEDIELCVRNAAAGVALRLAPDAQAWHDFCTREEDPIVTLSKRFRRYGASEHLLFERHPAFWHKQLVAETVAITLRELNAAWLKSSEERRRRHTVGSFIAA
jgi:hypothetical protein